MEFFSIGKSLGSKQTLQELLEALPTATPIWPSSPRLRRWSGNSYNLADAVKTQLGLDMDDTRQLTQTRRRPAGANVARETIDGAPGNSGQGGCGRHTDRDDHALSLTPRPRWYAKFWQKLAETS